MAIDGNTLRSYGLSLLFLGLAIGGLGQSLHIADSAKIAMSALSILCSISALILFVRAAPTKRRLIMLGVSMVTIFLSASGLIYFLTRR